MNTQLENILNKKPSTLIFFGHKYDIVFNNSLLTEKKEGRLSWAETIPSKHIIAFAEDIPKEWIFSVLIHECLELINFHFELELKHQDIMTLEMALFSILKDNNFLSKELNK